MTKVFFSHRLDLLSKHLTKELAADSHEVFASRTILVPNSALKQWVLLQIASESREKGVAGCKAITLQEALPSRFTEIFLALFYALSDFQHQDIRAYLYRARSESWNFDRATTARIDDLKRVHIIEKSSRRTVELAERLTGLLIRYENFCPSLLQKTAKTDHWQKQLIQSLFETGKLRLASQTSPSFLSPIYCFGFDYLPPAIWKLFNISSVYLFSPCRHYWEDLCTDRERKRIGLYWKRRGASLEKREELDAYLKNVPPLLANWGKAGRETLKIVDQLGWEIEEDYQQSPIEKSSSLARLKERLLDFVATEQRKQPEDSLTFCTQVAKAVAEGAMTDSSIQLSKTGSSPLQELEHLRLSILRLIEKEGLLCSDIAVLAPDIQPYASLIQLVFADLPFRIFGVEIGSKSFFYQGMHRFFELDLDDPMALFENPSFYRARGWDSEMLSQIREWLSQSMPDLEERLLAQFISIYPEEKQRISNGLADTLEAFIEIRQMLFVDLALLSASRTLAEWAKLLTSLMQKYFLVDHSNEADAAAWGFFKKTMEELEQVDGGGRQVPFELIQALLKKSGAKGHIHASHLHAIRFSTFSEGALVPVRALFLIGMDEDQFPRRTSFSSLDLLRGENVYTFEPIDQDRYLFLQSLFIAGEFLHISYSHLSSEGNPVNPCPFIEELIQSLDAPIREHKRYSHFWAERSINSVQASFPWPETPALLLPEGERVISLSDLSSLARHPWEFYLKKKLGIRFDPQDEWSFSRQKAKILRASLQKPLGDFLSEIPLGICGEALQIELKGTAKEWADAIQSWDLRVESISFKLSREDKKKGEVGWEFPPLEVFCSGSTCRVKLIGESKQFSSKGFIHTGDDHLEGLLRVWPECLAVLVASGRREIYCVKSGKIKIVEKPVEALKAFILYYFLSQSAPSPLLTVWADSLLRKGPVEWEKKMRDKLLGKGGRFEDPVWDWVSARIALPSPKTWFMDWEKHLRETFSELIDLYSPRRDHAPL